MSFFNTIKISLLLIMSVQSVGQNECNNKGIYDGKDCICLKEYITHPRDSKVQCNYELRSLKIAKFLSVFAGFLGFDMFYLGNNIKGIFKCFFPIIIFYIILRLQNLIKFESNSNYNYIIILPVLISFLMWIIDIIRISFGSIHDAYGYLLTD